MLHFPDVLNSPLKVAVFSGRNREDIWAALFLMHTLQKNFPETGHFLICRETDAELTEMLSWLPDLIFYGDSPISATVEMGEKLGSDAVLFYPYDTMDGEDANFIIGTGVGVCVSTANDPVVNLSVRIECSRQPEAIYSMCDTLRIVADRSWTPSIPSTYIERASAILAPVSGRALPYIVATTAAANIMEKNRCEIPVRMIVVEGKRSEIPDVTRGVMAAVVGGASAVATTDEWLWLKARALEVPTVGLDRRGVFPDWGVEPAFTDGDFLLQWADLLRRGW
jgi:hypothetical protein